MDKVPETILGLVGVVLTSVITVYKDEIGLAVTGKLKANQDLLGRWACTWRFAQAPGETEPARVVTDIVKIESISGEKVKATGENAPTGPYTLSGKLLRSSILTISWTGDGAREVLGGVAVLEINTLRNVMTGRWWEANEDRKFIGGEVQWIKQSK
jgi:hypothetical protein